MTSVPNRFPRNDIISLTSEPMRYDLAESVGPDLKLGELINDAFRSEFMELALSYGSASGNDLLRQSIAKRNGVSHEDVITTVGGMQALFLVAFILCEADSDVLIGRPVFPNARSVLEAVGANIAELTFSFDCGYRINKEQLGSLLTSGTRLVSFASPQNPSGVAMTEEEVKEVLSAMDAVCPEAFLLLDETYREAAYGVDVVQPSMVSLDKRIISCASLSKCHGAPGLRTGWIITRHPALRSQIMLGKFNTTISNSRVDDALAIRVMEDSDRIFSERRAHLQSGLERIADFVQQHSDAIEWVRPDAGALCCLRLKQLVFSDALTTKFYSELKKHDVRVGHGSWFGDEGRVFRIGFGLLSLVDLDEALARVSASIQKTIRDASIQELKQVS